MTAKARLSQMTEQALHDEVWRPTALAALPTKDDVLRDLVGRISYAFANTTEMTATLEADRVDGQIAVKLDDYTLWVWKDSDTTTADASHIAPTDVGVGAGRWSSLVEESMQIKTKYMLALINRVHMAADPPLVTVLAGGSNQSAINTQANLIKGLLLDHYQGVGTISVDDAHLASDTTNYTTLNAVANATSGPSAITLITAMKNTLVAHLTQAGVHFHDDSTSTLDGGYVDPPVSTANMVTDLEDIRFLMNTHFGLASQ